MYSRIHADAKRLSLDKFQAASIARPEHGGPPHSASRREFLRSSAALAATLAVGHRGANLLVAGRAQAQDAVRPPDADANRPRYLKAVKIDMVQVDGSLLDKMKTLKELGFDGVELNSPGGPEPDEVKRAIDDTQLPVHGVVDSIHWRQRLSDPDPEVRQRGLEGLITALRMSKAYGGTSVLLVPGRVIANEVTYEQCWERSIAEIRKALPVAEETGIQILLENVWNDFLTDPKETARYIDEINHPLVGAYFDVGNCVRYSPPHEWVPVLGQRIKKLDIKDYGHQIQFRAELLEGDVDWPKVMDELEKIGYSGWGTAEIPGGGRERLAVIAERMDRIFAS
jgi:hexulose-6-phosphate isomerase